MELFLRQCWHIVSVGETSCAHPNWPERTYCSAPEFGGNLRKFEQKRFNEKWSMSGLIFENFWFQMTTSYADSCISSLGTSDLILPSLHREWAWALSWPNVLCIINGPERIISTEIRGHYSPPRQYLVTYPICNMSSPSLSPIGYSCQNSQNLQRLQVLCLWPCWTLNFDLAAFGRLSTNTETMQLYE